MKRALFALALTAGALIANSAWADPASEAVLNLLKTKYPATTFTAVRPSNIQGIFEVQMGRNIAYTDDTGRNFLFGAMYDMQERQDLTAQRKIELGLQDPQQAQPRAQRAEPAPVSWASLPLKDALVRVNGTGARKLAVFADPNCRYCKQLEQALEEVKDVTVYTFVVPILGEDSASKGQSIWCSKNAPQAWHSWMLQGKEPGKVKDCASPIDRNAELASKLGVRGTPTLIAADGRRLPGAASADRISSFLDAGANVASK